MLCHQNKTILVTMTMFPIANVVSKAVSSHAALHPEESKTVAGDNAVPFASPMPTVRQLDAGIQVIDPSVSLQRNFTDMPLARVYHPRQAPSAFSSENFLAARAAMNPGFMHNVAHTNRAHISNLYKEAPRFRNDLDLIAWKRRHNWKLSVKLWGNLSSPVAFIIELGIGVVIIRLLLVQSLTLLAAKCPRINTN